MANPSLDASKSGGYVGINKLDSAKALEEKLKQLQQSRTFDKQWRLNLAFYKGRQYSYYNRTSNVLTTLPVEDGDKPRYRVRLVSNQIVSGVSSLLSKYLKTKPRMFATPGTGSHKDLKAAQMADKLLNFWWTDFALDDALEEAILYSLIAGQGYWKICWDEHAGRQMSFLLNPQGQPITEEPIKEAFRAQLEQMGIPPAEQTAYLGDIRVEVISPFDLYVDPSVKKFTDSKWAFQVMYLTPEEIKTRYGKELPPDSIATSPDVGLPLGQSNQQSGTGMDVRKVVCGYFLPQPAMPRGRIVTWSGAEILEDKPWDYPTHELPFVKFPGLRIPGSVYDMSVVEQAIPLQKELNRTLSQIVEFKNMTVKPQWIAPIGSLRERRTDEPGAIYQYNPVAGLKPEPMQIESLPTWVFNHLEEINGRLNDLFGRTEVTEGAVPPNVEAGVAIDLLQEMATDRIAPQIRLMEMALARAGQLMLALAKEYYIEPRMLKIVGSAGSTQVKQFTNADIDGQINVQVEAGSGLPRTRAGRQARIEFLINNQIINPSQAYQFMDSGDLAGLAEQFSQDEDQAYRENEKLDVGEPLNPLAIQNAQAMIPQVMQQGMNPDTGQPFQDMQEFQMWAQHALQQAAIQPGPVDNHAIHIDVHGRTAKSVEWFSLPPEAQQAYIDHINAHMQALQSQQVSPSEPVRTTLQLKSTVGPTVQSKILQQQGIQTSPEESAEPPLETWVTDSVDKADVDGDSPGQDGGINLAKVAAINAEAQANALDKHHSSLHSNIKGQMDVLSQAQKAQQDAELHDVKMQQARANATAAEHKARHAARPPAKGKG